MVDDLKRIDKCKICKKNSSTLYECDLTSVELKNFLNNYYQKDFLNYFNFKNKLVKNFILKKCNSCEFIWQGRVLNENDNFKLYEKLINWKKSLRKSIKKSKINNFNLDIFIINELIKKNKKNILDFGAGWGHWAANTLIKDVYCYELSEIRISYMKKKN